MKKQKTLWILGLSLLALTVLTAYFYTREYIDWNVPLYGAAIALLFFEGAGMFALLAAAKERPKKRVVLSVGVLVCGCLPLPLSEIGRY